MISAATGAKLFVGGVQNIKAPMLSDYVDDSYVEVGEIESIGNFGDTTSPISFTSLADSRVQKIKGPRDAGNSTIVFADDPTDEGQAALNAAEAEIYDYNFYVQLNDALSIGGDGSKHYFKAKVMGKEIVVGSATNVVKRNIVLGINSAITEVAAS